MGLTILFWSLREVGLGHWPDKGEAKECDVASGVAVEGAWTPSLTTSR